MEPMGRSDLPRTHRQKLFMRRLFSTGARQAGPLHSYMPLRPTYQAQATKTDVQNP